MRRFIVCVAWIPLLWKPTWGQPPREGKGQPSTGSNTAAGRNGESRENQIGTQTRPLIVDNQGHKKSKQEAADDRAEKEHMLETERRTLRAVEWTAYAALGLVLVGACGTIAAVWTLRQIKRQADLIERQANTMEQQLTDARTASAQQVEDVRASIAEAAKSAKAMEGVAESMASNAESVRHSVAISREIADTQKLAIELQGRAYLSVFFDSAFYQDVNHVFEVTAVIKNHGNTPAYDVVFKATAQIVLIPIPEDFAYPLPDNSAGGSVSLIAPGTTKLVHRALAERIPDNEVDTVKRGGPPMALAMWGIVNYRDAFNKIRHIKFAFTVYWQPGLPEWKKTQMGISGQSHNTAVTRPIITRPISIIRDATVAVSRQRRQIRTLPKIWSS